MLISEGNCTMLDTSFRMCGPICDFVSELFYDGELKAIRRDASDRIICGDPLYSFDAPIVLKEIDDEGEQASEKEAAFIADTIAIFLPTDCLQVILLCCRRSGHRLLLSGVRSVIIRLYRKWIGIRSLLIPSTRCRGRSVRSSSILSPAATSTI